MTSPDEKATVSDGTRERIESDPFCALLGVEVLSLEPGRATTRLVLRDEHANFHGTPHGGAVYTLADAAFAAASNAGDATRVALETNVSYLGASSVGETLVAVASETHATRRTAEYGVVVRRRNDTGNEGSGNGNGNDRANASDGDGANDGDETTGERIATFRGRAYRV